MPTALEKLQGLAATNGLAAPTPAPGPTGAEAARQVTTPQAVSEQEAVQKLIQATSGKGAAVGGLGPQAPSVAAEQATAQQIGVQKRTLLEQLQAQDEQQEQQQVAALQELSLQELEVKEKALSVRQQFVNETNKILLEYKQRGQELDLMKEGARLEQAGVMMRLNSDKYVAQLKNEARRNGLTNKKKFFEAALQAAFEGQMELIKSDLSFRSMLKADDRAFERKLAQMDIDTAWAILQGELSASSTKMQYTAIAGGLQTGIQAAKDYAQSQPVSDEGVTKDGQPR